MATGVRGPGPAPLTLGRSNAGLGRVRLAVAGEVDLTNVRRLSAAIAEILHEPTVTELVLDVASLEFIDSLGVQALLEARRLAESRQARLSVVNPLPIVMRVLTVLGVHELLIAPDPDAA
jgi:anti-sigma B factor antagonist